MIDKRRLFETERKLKLLRLIHAEHISFVLGILLCSIGTLVMMIEESISGERTTRIATLLGIVGIGLMGTSGARLLRPKNQS